MGYGYVRFLGCNLFLGSIPTPPALQAWPRPPPPPPPPPKQTESKPTESKEVWIPLGHLVGFHHLVKLCSDLLKQCRLYGKKTIIHTIVFGLPAYFTLPKTNMAGWKSPSLIGDTSSIGCFSVVMLVFRSVFFWFIPCACTQMYGRFS